MLGQKKKTDKKAMSAEDEEKEIEAYRAAINGVKKVRFRVLAAGILMPQIALCVALCCACSLIGSNVGEKNKALTLVLCIIGAVMGAVALTLLIISSVAANRKNYAYYYFDGENELSAFFSSKTAVLFDGKTGYKVEKGEIITLDRDAYLEFWDGECTGLCALRRAPYEKFTVIGAGNCIAETELGGNEALYSGGVITKVISVAPVKTGLVNGKTGEEKINRRIIEKKKPCDEFEFCIPEFVTDAFEKAGMPVPDFHFLDKRSGF